MQTVADRIIDALGGTTAVSRMTDTPLSTVHSWRRNGIPRSRLAHLKLVARHEKPDVDLDAFSAATTICCLCDRSSADAATDACRHTDCPVVEERIDADHRERGLLVAPAERVAA